MIVVTGSSSTGDSTGGKMRMAKVRVQDELTLKELRPGLYFGHISQAGLV